MTPPKVSLTPIQRKAEFAKHATLREKPISRAAEEDLKVSWTHLRECFEGLRTPSDKVAAEVAEYVGMSVEDFWGERLAAAS
jgi:hypothetical protein